MGSAALSKDRKLISTLNQEGVESYALDVSQSMQDLGKNFEIKEP